MHFIDAWRELSIPDLVRLLAPIVLIVLSTFLPGARVARGVAVLIALFIPGLREMAAPLWLVAAWMLLWLAIAWRAGGHGEGEPAPIAGRGVFETGTLGLLLGAALLALLVAAVARQDMSPEDSRRASCGALLIGAGMLHLMLRRNAWRAALAFGAMGLGLQVLDGAARGAQVQRGLSAPGAVWLATALAVMLVFRVAWVRERFAGSPWVPDAHDLHD